MLYKNSILCASDELTEDVEVPEWCGAVRVKSMTVADRAKVFALAAKYGEGFQPACILAVTVIDEYGARMFSDEDVPAIAAKSAAAVGRVVAVAARLASLGSEKKE